MRLPFGMLVLGLALLVHRDDAAAAAGPLFDPLRAELVQRRDNDFTGILDAAARKRRDAVLESISILDAAGTTLRDDATTAYKTAKKLRKAYPDELAIPDTPEEDLGEIYGTIFDDLVARIEAAHDEVAAQLNGLPARLAEKVRKGLEKADSILADLHPTDRVKAAKDLVKAAKAVLKADGRIPPPETLSVRINAVALGTPADPTIRFEGKDLEIDAFNGGGNGFTLSLTVTTPVTEPAIYQIVAASIWFIGNGIQRVDYFLVAGTGTLTVTALGGGRIAGSFLFDGELLAPVVMNPGSVEVDGTFEASLE